MALPASGALSLNEIHIEAGGATGTTASINDSDIRDMIAKAAASTMSFSEWYGASSTLSSYTFEISDGSGNTGIQFDYHTDSKDDDIGGIYAYRPSSTQNSMRLSSTVLNDFTAKWHTYDHGNKLSPYTTSIQQTVRNGRDQSTTCNMNHDAANVDDKVPEPQLGLFSYNMDASHVYYAAHDLSWDVLPIKGNFYTNVASKTTAWAGTGSGEPGPDLKYGLGWGYNSLTGALRMRTNQRNLGTNGRLELGFTLPQHSAYSTSTSHYRFQEWNTDCRAISTSGYTRNKSEGGFYVEFVDSSSVPDFLISSSPSTSDNTSFWNFNSSAGWGIEQASNNNYTGY